MSSKEQSKNNEKSGPRQKAAEQGEPNRDVFSRQSANPTEVIRRAKHDPRLLTSNDFLKLQRSVGNRAVASLLSGSATNEHSHPHHNQEDKKSQGATPGRHNAGGGSGIGSAPHESLVKPGSSGRSLPNEVRRFMEPRFGTDFGRVRVHTDPDANTSADALNARAYTLGSDIVFGSGEYSPDTLMGKSLIAHELAHVIQQQNAPSGVQRRLTIGGESDSAEIEADAAAHSVMNLDKSPYHSSALQIRHRLRASASPQLVIRRAVTTWGGEFSTPKYVLTSDPGLDGVDIELKFMPNKHVDAKKIGMVQSVRASEKGVPFAIGAGKEKKTLESRMVPSGETGAGTMIDRLASYGNPLYPAEKPSPGDSLSDTPTSDFWGQHGWRYTDKDGKEQKQHALLKDKPQLFSRRKESSQVFETTALAVEGTQENTFYGSVQWGWRKDAAGKVKKLPLTVVSNDVPSGAFAAASKQWSKTKTSEGKDVLAMPTVSGKYTNYPRVWLVENPSKYKATRIGKLEKNTRLEVTDKGESKRFNRTTDKYKWWKVTVVDGTYIGQVGWVMRIYLSDKKVT